MTWKHFHFATSAEQAVELLGRYGPAGHIVAGGTDLLVQLREAPSQAQALIDLTRAPDLAAITLSPDGEAIQVGATTTCAELLHSDLVWEHAPLLAQAAAQMGSVQIRSLATLGGNLCTASPAGDTLPALLALDARIGLLGPRGPRTVPAFDFFLHVRKPPGSLMKFSRTCKYR